MKSIKELMLNESAGSTVDIGFFDMKTASSFLSLSNEKYYLTVTLNTRWSNAYPRVNDLEEDIFAFMTQQNFTKEIIGYSHDIATKLFSFTNVNKEKLTSPLFINYDSKLLIVVKPHNTKALVELNIK